MVVFEYDLYFNSITGFYEVYQNGLFIYKTKDKNLFVNKVLSLLEKLGGAYRDW